MYGLSIFLLFHSDKFPVFSLGELSLALAQRDLI